MASGLDGCNLIATELSTARLLLGGRAMARDLDVFAALAVTAIVALGGLLRLIG